LCIFETLFVDVHGIKTQSIFMTFESCFISMSVRLTGPYYSDSYGEGGPNTVGLKFSGLTIGRIIQGRFTPYRIDHQGIPIGWAPRDSLETVGGAVIEVGTAVKGIPNR
jgi:hypothetical protein